MTSFMQRTARQFLLTKAARQISQLIEEAGLDKLTTLAEAGVSVVGTFLNGCSPHDKAIYRQELGLLLQVGVTIEMLLDEIAGQMPSLAPIMRDKVDYRNAEIKSVLAFVNEGGG
ncbi:hypothetical protein ES703_114249 [subsurface metagenome]